MVSDLSKLEQVPECFFPDWMDDCVRSGSGTVLYFSSGCTILGGCIKKLRTDVFLLVTMKQFNLNAPPRIITRHWKVCLDEWLMIDFAINKYRHKINWSKDGF